uniref:Uncharacterized protein n=1 Tax=Glossina austeni TaxID=7395 RepID=A0A1A9VBJ1_GLOAU
MGWQRALLSINDEKPILYPLASSLLTDAPENLQNITFARASKSATTIPSGLVDRGHFPPPSLQNFEIVSKSLNVIQKVDLSTELTELPAIKQNRFPNNYFVSGFNSQSVDLKFQLHVDRRSARGYNGCRSVSSLWAFYTSSKETQQAIPSRRQRFSKTSPTQSGSHFAETPLLVRITAIWIESSVMPSTSVRFDLERNN